MTPDRTDAVVVVVPAYEPSPRLVGLVDDLLAQGFGRIVLVDDGSGPDYRTVFTQAADRSGVTLLRHPLNRGKGAALRTGLSAVIEAAHAGDDILGAVTVDADGQHLPADVRRVADALIDRMHEPRVAILGERDFNLPDIPARSRFGNKMTTGIVRAIFGRRLPDTQTGLRAVSVDLLPELTQVPGDRFDHEMRVLMHLLSSRATILSVPISTVYEGGVNDTSHFRPLRDSAIIYGAILRQVGLFALSSGGGFLVDIGVFVLVMDLAFDGTPTLVAVGVSTLVARVVSALTNYTINHVVVFASRERAHRAVGRYILLASGILGASWVLTTGLSHLLGHHVVWAKIVVDTGLFAVSYLAQKHWVFRAREEAGAAATEKVAAGPG